MRNFILGSIISLLFSCCIYFYILNNSLKASLNTYRNDKELVDKEIQKAKEDYYIQNQSDNLTIILFTVTGLFTIFAAVSFFGVKSEFKSAIKKNDERYEDYKTQYDSTITHIHNLKSSLSLQLAEKISNDFGKVLLEKPLDISKLIWLGLTSCQNYCFVIVYSSNNSNELKSLVTKFISPIMDVMVEKVNSVDKIELDIVSYSEFLTIKNSLDSVLDKDNLQKFSFVFSKLSFLTVG